MNKLYKEIEKIYHGSIGECIKGLEHYMLVNDSDQETIREKIGFRLNPIFSEYYVESSNYFRNKEHGLVLAIDDHIV